MTTANGGEGRSNDSQHSDNDGTGLDDMEYGDGIEGSDQGDESLPWTDAGVSEDAQEAKKDTQKLKLKMVEKKEKGDDTIRQARQLELNLIKRAKALKGLDAFNYGDVKLVRSGDMMLPQPMPTDGNRFHAFDVLFGGAEEEGRPHIDLFRGRFVDWNGEIVDDHYSMRLLVDVLAAAGLNGCSSDSARKAFREWGMMVKTNDLIAAFDKKVPEWDAVERCETSLIELFGCFDTPLNRKFALYFWLSVYCRVTSPGCMAPMVLSLFGAQDAGKSYFTKLIVQTILGNKTADAVQLDLGASPVDFLRKITGNSIIANVGEMTGFNRGDLNKIKNFITRTSDSMDYKYEGHFEQQRQWITVMDGNKYEGLQRDDTGNRRLYPMFVGQLPDKDGQPAWAETYSADFTGFADKVWQMMAECRAWLAANGGEEGYNALVKDVGRDVAAFSREEMSKDRGTIRDDDLDNYLVLGLLRCEGEAVAGTKHKGVWFSTAEINNCITMVSKGKVHVKNNHLPNKMSARGAERHQHMNVNGYIWRGVDTVHDVRKMLRGGSDTPLDAETKLADDNGGF